MSASTHGKVAEKIVMPADFYDAEISEMQVTLEPSTDHRIH
ncbi:hypothetical protein [Nostoc sp.]